MKVEQISEKIICDGLNRKYSGNCKYKLANVFVFKRDWESDFFVLKDNGYSYEFEVKISRSDFLQDKKKVDKHLILQSGLFGSGIEHSFRPNKFFYVVPENLVSINEIPSYAGLMYYTPNRYDHFITIKEAPFIHKEKLCYEGVLCNKFYNYWLNAKNEIIDLKFELEYLKKRLRDNKAA